MRVLRVADPVRQALRCGSFREVDGEVLTLIRRVPDSQDSASTEPVRIEIWFAQFHAGRNGDRVPQDVAVGTRPTLLYQLKLYVSAPQVFPRFAMV